MYRYADVSLEMSKIDWCGIKKWLAVISIFRVGIRNSLCSSTSTTICSTESADLAERSRAILSPRLAPAGGVHHQRSSTYYYVVVNTFKARCIYLHHIMHSIYSLFFVVPTTCKEVPYIVSVSPHGMLRMS